MTALGAIVATIGVGVLGDAVGLRTALLFGVGISSLALPFVLVLPRRVAVS